MSFFDKVFGKKEAVAEEEYIDLTEWTGEPTKEGEEDVKMMVKIAEIYSYEDLSAITTHVYNGNMLLLDYSPIAGDDIVMKRVTNELRQLSQDLNGDVAGIGKNMLLVTPTGVRIDRKKLRGKL
jgi:hypothetical protein